MVFFIAESPALGKKIEGGKTYGLWGRYRIGVTIGIRKI
jgi:hypothetical protein